MKNILGAIALTIVIAVCVMSFNKSADEHQIRIGIVVPLQHAALDAIIDGFSAELKTQLGESNLHIEVQNALGDVNLQRTALNKFINDKVDMLVPVATGTTQMALQLSQNKIPLLFLAANITPDSPSAQHYKEIMGVVDELPLAFQVQCIKTIMPQLQHITVVYSSSDKVFDEVNVFKKIATEQGINVQSLMIQTLADLYTVSQHIEPQSQALFILKDNLVVSGIATLVQQANTLKIPLITSDEASIAAGAAFAVGVREADIGRYGAKIAAQFLKKQPIDQKIQLLTQVSLFVNTQACEQQGVEISTLENAARELKLEMVKG